MCYIKEIDFWKFDYVIDKEVLEEARSPKENRRRYLDQRGKEISTVLKKKREREEGNRERVKG